MGFFDRMAQEATYGSGQWMTLGRYVNEIVEIRMFNSQQEKLPDGSPVPMLAVECVVRDFEVTDATMEVQEKGANGVTTTVSKPCPVLKPGQRVTQLINFSKQPAFSNYKKVLLALFPQLAELDKDSAEGKQKWAEAAEEACNSDPKKGDVNPCKGMIAVCRVTPKLTKKGLPIGVHNWEPFTGDAAKLPPLPHGAAAAAAEEDEEA